MAGGHDSPAENLQNLSKAELLLHKLAMNHARRLSGKQPLNKKASGIYPVRESFVLEDHKLKNKVDQLEKQKQQCIHRYKEDAHMFRMSVKLPPQRSEEYWSQYGEKFHANGDWRENHSLLRLPPQPSPRPQSGTARKECHGSNDISKTPTPSKTVSDLITLMREGVPFMASASNPDPSAHAYPLQSSSTTGLSQYPNPINVRNERLRVLLENYEVFVPCGSDVDDQEGDNDDDEEEEKEKEKDLSLNTKDEDKRESPKQSRSKSVNDIKKVELLGIAKFRRARSQSAQAKQVKQGFQDRHRKRNSAPARDIAYGALRVHSLQPRVSKYNIKNQSPTKSSETLFRSPSRRVHERTESSASQTESENDKTEKDESNGSFEQECSQIPRGIESRHRMKNARNEFSFKKFWNEKKESSKGLENARARRNQKSKNDGKKDGFDSKTIEKDTLETITYCFSETGEFYTTAEETDLHIRTIPARVTSGCPREATRRARFEESYKSRSPTDVPSPGKVSIKNILPEFPLDIEMLRRASKQSVVNEVKKETNPVYKPQRLWRPKPKSAAPFGRKSSTFAEHDAKVVNRQPDHLAHASVKARRPGLVILGKSLDKKKQEKETREKMDRFFARLDSTKNNQTTLEVHKISPPTRPNTATLRTRERRLKKQEYQRQTERMYKRAAPWPVQVWC